eukprot:XP_001697255.1 assembly factor 2 for F1 mitochondrial ATP synthase, splice variant b [Chlamydomonas reinhardtii]
MATSWVISQSRPSASRLLALLPHLFVGGVREAHTSASNTTSKISRFYKAAHVVPAEDRSGFQVMLDRKPVRTPGKKLAVLPSHPLALAVAAEWEWQEKGKPQLHTMPMMSLVAHALDQPRPRDKVIAHIMNYVHTDAACCLYERGTLALPHVGQHRGQPPDGRARGGREGLAGRPRRLAPSGYGAAHRHHQVGGHTRGTAEGSHHSGPGAGCGACGGGLPGRGMGPCGGGPRPGRGRPAQSRVRAVAVRAAAADAVKLKRRRLLREKRAAEGRSHRFGAGAERNGRRYC